MSGPMSEPSGVEPAAPPDASSQAEQGKAVAGTGAPKQLSLDATLGSMNELRTKAPELYEAMVKGIAQKICNEMRQHQEDLKRLMREGRSGG